MSAWDDASHRRHERASHEAEQQAQHDAHYEQMQREHHAEQALDYAIGEFGVPGILTRLVAHMTKPVEAGDVEPF